MRRLVNEGSFCRLRDASDMLADGWCPSLVLNWKSALSERCPLLGSGIEQIKYPIIFIDFLFLCSPPHLNNYGRWIGMMKMIFSHLDAKALTGWDWVWSTAATMPGPSQGPLPDFEIGYAKCLLEMRIARMRTVSIPRHRHSRSRAEIVFGEPTKAVAVQQRPAASEKPERPIVLRRNER